jgi:hypothetical protein
VFGLPSGLPLQVPHTCAVDCVARRLLSRGGCQAAVLDPPSPEREARQLAGWGLTHCSWLSKLSCFVGCNFEPGQQAEPLEELAMNAQWHTGSRWFEEPAHLFSLVVHTSDTPVWLLVWMLMRRVKDNV